MQPLGIKVARIDGGISTNQRLDIVRQNRVICMTPDVVQAWLMRSLAEKPVANLLQNLGLLVLDEAHTYEGVFGTNMAYLLRRLEVASNRFQILLSTATLDEPERFAKELTGRDLTCLRAQDETNAVSDKKVVVLRPEGKPEKALEAMADLLADLSKIASQQGFRFLAFGDARKLVERIVVLTQRRLNSSSAEEDEIADDAEDNSDTMRRTVQFCRIEQALRRMTESLFSGG